MNEDQIRQLIRQEITNYTPTFTNLNVTPHVHNGSDAPQIPPENLAAYTPYNPGSNASGSLNPTTNGTFVMYNQFDGTFTPPSSYDYGFQLYLNNTWNVLDLADFYVYATKTNTQTIANNATDTIIFNTVESQYPTTPSNIYDNTTGIWDVPTVSAEIITATVTFAAGAAGGYVTISYNDGPIVRSVSAAVPAVKFSVSITAINDSTTLSGQRITITNKSGRSMTTVADETFLQVKQLK